MAITVAEKNHWKERIERKIDQAINELIVGGDPKFKDKLEEAARERAIDSLGIRELMKRHEELQLQIDSLQSEENEVVNSIERQLNTSYKKSGEYSSETRIESAIKEMQSIAEKVILSESDFGQKILNLRREKEELLDTVWLATSPMQITNLWTRVIALFGDSLTELQEQTVKSQEASMSDSD